LAETHAASVAGDALIAVALAGTLFFSVPSTDARQNVALYLLITLAPFAVIGPLLGRVYERVPGSYRAGLVLSSLGRVGAAIGLGFLIDSLWIFPIAFLLLVLSRFHGISRSSVLPVVVRNADELIDANARLARAGVIAAAIVVPLGAVVQAWIGSGPVILGAIALYVVSAIAAVQLPPIRTSNEPARSRKRYALPRPLRLARFATASVRFLNGYLVLLVAFAFRDADAGVASLAALLAAAGVGFFVAAWLAPVLGRHVREEPMVVGALAVMAIAAFIGAQTLSLLAAIVVALAAGFSWGTAKFAFDGMMHVALPERERGRAFTNAETMFQIGWVLGALIPVLPFWPVTLGLASAGVVALIIQVGYVSLVLVPESVRSLPASEPKPDTGEPPALGVLDLI
ncbi:MAG: MFS transporter, partial [Actinomycetia bacterium]|nr:MFS transporter [Actinomycetes bacterium]